MYNLNFGGDPAYLLLAVGALFVHTCYQLSVSVLTYLSSHGLSRGTSVKKLLSLGTAYALGAVVTTSLILFSAVSLAQIMKDSQQLLSLLTVAVAPVVGLATMLWYYRRGEGTRLWLPRPVARYLLDRSKKTKSSFEAAVLGAATVIGELPFISAPLLFITLIIVQTPSTSWAAWSLAYSALAYLPLFVITMYLTSGHSIARVQKWRETNKTFLQWASGGMLILLTLYLTVLQVGVY